MRARRRQGRGTEAVGRSPVVVVLAACVWSVGGLGLLPVRGAAQSGDAALRGAVVDATTTAPVGEATVVLEPEFAGAFPGAQSGFASSSRTTITNDRGWYHFGDLVPGRYRLYVTRLGYRPYSVVVELKGPSSSVSVGLEAEPIALEPVRSRGRAQGSYATGAFGADVEPGRAMALDLRRRQFLTTDSRELTQADVAEGVTLGEPDVFRALQRLPGVTTRSDYTAELWTRGAPWYQTRVYYDGLPLYNPLHALGMLSGLSSGALGTVWFHPGVRPTSMGEGAAGVLDLRSRRGAGAGALNLQGDLSMMSAGLSMDQRVMGGDAGWRLTARRSYLDWLSELARQAASQEDGEFPYSFSEVSGHVDAWVGTRSSVEASFLWEGDRLSSSGARDPIHADWGNVLVQGTWTTRLAGLNVQHSAGTSAHAGTVAWDSAALNIESGTFTVFGPEELSESGIRYRGLRGSFWPDPQTLAGPAWSAGYEVAEQTARYAGPFPLPFPRPSADQLSTSKGQDQPVSVRWSATLPQISVWGEKNWALAPRWSLRTGLRAEVGEDIENVGGLRLAPRLAVRYAPEPDVSLSAGYARVYQYSQSLAPAGVQMASLVSTDVWLLAGPDVPALQSDIVTGGVEAVVGPGRIAAFNAFGRRATGVTLPDPRPGPVFDRALFVSGTSRAYGVELSVRQVTGPVTGSVGYSWTRSRTAAGDFEFPASADRTHVLDGTAMLRVFEPFRIGAAMTVATGVPFTQTVSDPDICVQVPGCDPNQLPWTGSPNAVRAPTYASLDLLVDWSREIAGMEVGIYGQIRNVLGRDNAVVYTGNNSACITVGCSIDELRNRYERGVPRLPVIGIRVRK